MLVLHFVKVEVVLQGPNTESNRRFQSVPTYITSSNRPPTPRPLFGNGLVARIFGIKFSEKGVTNLSIYEGISSYEVQTYCHSDQNVVS